MDRFRHYGIVVNHLMLAIVFSVFAVVGMPSVAQATFPGQNGRIFWVAGTFSTSSTIMSACPDGTHVKVVVPLASYPSPSPDGTRIAYLKLQLINNQIAVDGVWIANADGSNPVLITNSESLPTWSPDGTKLTFQYPVFYPTLPFPTTPWQPVVADVATKVITPLLSDPSIVGTSPVGVGANVWTPDGTQIFFPGSKNGSHGADVYRVAAGGGIPTRVLGTDDELPYTQWFDISPDGISILEQHQGTDISDMLDETWRYPLDGGSGTKVLENNPNEGTGDEMASYSPDGTKIVFNRVLSEQIMTADPDGSNVALLGGVGSGIGGSFAHWSTNVDGCSDPGDPGAATMKINEVGLGAARFIELLDPADETFPTAQQPYRVVVYDGAGTRQNFQTISSALLQGRDNTKPLLLSTAAADLAYGVTGDVVLSLALPNPGQACFTKGFDEAKVDCVSWGCVTAAVSTSSTRIPAPDAGISAQRQGVGSTTFHLATPTPKATNVAGTAVPACGPGALPTVTGIVPASGTILGGTAVSITGTNFTGATGVTIGGTTATPFTVVNSTTITTTTPAHGAGGASVLVTTPGGTNPANTLFAYSLPVRIAETLVGYSSIQAADAAALTGQTIQVQAETYSENLVFVNPVSIVLKGGYDSTFATNAGTTTVAGSLTISSNGAVVIDNIGIQ
ncbi:MAG: IPT/TIG domain-containing protein [Thermodesulfovibrionales bacterium]